MADQDQAEFEGWAIIELMGHRRVAGYVTEREVAGARFLQVGIPTVGGETRTQLYAPQAVYCITPVAEEVARAVAVHARPLVVSAWELRELLERNRDEDDHDGYAECDEDEEDEGDEDDYVECDADEDDGEPDDSVLAYWGGRP